MTPSIVRADLSDPAHGEAILLLVESYADEALPEEVRQNMVPGMRALPTALVLLAYLDDEPAGIATCFWGYSTWRAKPLLNIHDLAVLPTFRGQGAGKALLAEAERCAREAGACGLTLEVRAANEGAKRLYRAQGFGPWDDGKMLFLSKAL